MPFCCVIGCSNATHDRNGHRINKELRFFRIPKAKTTYGEQVKAVTQRRRRAWVSAIRRTNITFEHSPDYARVCSKHFHKGVPSYEMLESDPDWAPSIHLGHHEVKPTNTSRHERHKDRMTRKQMVAQCPTEPEVPLVEEAEMEATPEAEELPAVLVDLGGLDGLQIDCTQSVQTDLLSGDIDALTQEINWLREENRTLKELLDKKNNHLNSFEGNDEKVKYYTGLHSFAMLMCVFGIVKEHLPQGNRRVLLPFQMLILTLMKLRLNLPVQHLAYMFDVHRTTIMNNFVDTLNIMYKRLLKLIYWPDRESLQESMPHQFVEAFGKNVAVIIDCFEIFIERPSNLKAQSQTFSSYKHNNTMKYLIGITPKGAISFISKGWGGRTSDKHITENSGFLNNLLPGDMVLADRGFDIQESVGLMCAEVKLPAFTKGKCQMHAQDIETTRKLAHLRIHVERVIGNVRNKFSLLSDTIPINLILPCEGEELIFLDKIVTVCCALTNMCPSVV